MSYTTDAFRKELHLREKCNFVSSSLDKGDKSSSLRQRSFQPLTAATLYTESQEKHDRFTPWCVFCKGKHRANQCNVVIDVATRKRLLRQKARCFLCLKGGYIMRNCKNQLFVILYILYIMLYVMASTISLYVMVMIDCHNPQKNSPLEVYL